MRINLSVTAATFMALFVALPSAADDQRIVELRYDCPAGAANCFETTSQLTEWLWMPGGRTNPPSAADRVVVVAGPGTFDRFVCDASGTPRGWVSIVGAGRGVTRFESNDGSVEPASGQCYSGITVNGCSELNFQDLTAFGSVSGVLWLNGGSATWTDVDMVGGGATAISGCGAVANAYGWWDRLAGGSVGSKHFFFGSRARASGIAGGGAYNVGFYMTSGAEVWFYGGDILAESELTSAIAQNAAVLQLGPKPHHFQGFGTSLRSLVGNATGGAFTVFAGASIMAASGTFHMHGGVISADASAATVNVSPVGVLSNGFAHLYETAFAVKPAGTGTATRVAGTGNVESPFLWKTSNSPPTVVSKNGNDLFVDTEAGPGNNESHLMVYDTGCNGMGGTWRDMATGECREP
jgi:hypothetical protein